MNTASRTAVVTGGTRGIGREICTTLASSSYNLVIVFKNTGSHIDELKQHLQSCRITVDFIQSDISHYDEITKITNIVSSQYKTIDLLINNAGIYIKNTFENSNEKMWDTTFNTNLKSAYFLTQKLLPLLKNTKNAQIINIASISGSTLVSNSLDYALSKNGLLYLTRVWAKLFAPDIRVNAISPGPTATDMTGYELNPEKRIYIESRIPMKSINTPSDIAFAIQTLISEHSRNVTGQVLQIDGGLSLV